MDDLLFNNADLVPAGPVDADVELSLAAFGMLLMTKDAESRPEAPSAAVSLALLEGDLVSGLPYDLAEDGLLLG